MEARQAQGADWEALRQLRLRALADAPDAFASTLEAEVAFPAEVWRQRVRDRRQANFIRPRGGSSTSAWPRSFAGRMLLTDASCVDVGRPGLPTTRGGPGPRRTGRALGGRPPGHEVVLWVADHNTAARRLYEQIGFRPTGKRQPLPSNPALTESQLHLPLCTSQEQTS